MDKDEAREEVLERLTQLEVNIRSESAYRRWRVTKNPSENREFISLSQIYDNFKKSFEYYLEKVREK